MVKQRPSVLFISPSAYPLGGVAVWLSYLIPDLSILGWKVTLGLVKGEFHDAKSYLERNPTFERTLEIENQTGSKLGRVNSLFDTFVKEQPDIIVVVNIVDVYEAARRYKLTLSKPVKIVTTLHAIEEDLLNDIAASADVIDAVISTNRLTQKVVQDRCGYSSAHNLYAPYGVDDVIPVLRMNKELLTIGFCGRFEQQQKRIKDIPRILKSLDSLDVKWRFLFAGAGPEEKELLSSLNEPCLKGKTHYLGSLAHKDMKQKFYDLCDVLLITSSWETGPIVALEAMVNGVVTVSSKFVGSVLEGALNDHENCRLFSIGDTAAAASILAEVNEPNIQEALRQGGFQLIRSRHTRGKSVEAWSTKLEQVLDLPVNTRKVASIIITPSGRLDKVFGVSMGEKIRRTFGIKYTHQDAGGEWPHSYSKRNNDFLSLMAMFDKTDGKKKASL